MQLEFSPIASSGGTTTEFRPNTPNEIGFVVVENMAMIGSVSLDAAPSEARYEKRSALRAAVLASVERSLKEHADVWAELSKY